MPRIETIRVIADNDQGFKIINKDDFDPAKDKEYVKKTRTTQTKKDK